MLVTFAITLAPLAGADTIVKVVPETVKSVTGANFLPDLVTANIWTSLGVELKVNAVVEPSPVNVFVADTVGLFNLLEIAKALILFKSMTGDNFVFVELNVKFVTNDLEPDISFVSFISLATSFGSVKYMLSPRTIFLVELVPARLNGVSEPCTDLPVVVLIFAVKFVSGCITCPTCNCITSNCLFCVAVTLEPPTSPVAFAAPPATTS